MRALRPLFVSLLSAWLVALATAALVPAGDVRVAVDSRSASVRQAEERPAAPAAPRPHPESPRFPAQAPDLSLQAPRAVAAADWDCNMFASTGALPVVAADPCLGVTPYAATVPPQSYRVTPARPRAPPRA